MSGPESRREKLSGAHRDAEARRILETVTDAFVALDRDWHYTYVNERAAEIFGRRAEDLVGKHIWTEFPEGVDQRFYHAYHRAMREQTPLHVEDYFPPWDRWFENRIYPSREGLAIFFQDVTVRKRAELMLAAHTRVFERIAARAPLTETLSLLAEVLEPESGDMICSVLVLDDDGVRVRHACAPHLPAEFVGAIDGLPIGPTAGSCGTAMFRKERVIVADIANDPLWAPYRALALAHGLRACWSDPILSVDGKVLGACAIYHKKPCSPGPRELALVEKAISLARLAIEASRKDDELRELNRELERRVAERTEELRQANVALEEQNRRVREATRLKSEFLANMSHELRTPLNGIIGFSELLYDGRVGALSDQQSSCIRDILSSGRHLVQLINDILDLAKVEAGKLELRPEPFDLRDLAGSVQATLRALGEEKHIAIATDLDAAVCNVVADPAKMRQVLYNLLSNALKFTPDGGHVTLRARAEGDAALRIEVEDDGIGIPEHERGRLFNEFVQLDGSASKRYPGTGLGLALVKRIVEAQGGRVGVTSAPVKGSVFFVVLPRVAEARAP